MAENETSRGPEAPPTEDLDGRSLGDWVSRWRDAPGAWSQIKLEVAFVGMLLLLLPAGLVVVFLRWPSLFLGIGTAQYATLTSFAYAWLGGTYGGTLFDAKWLYHGVAKGSWHSDRLIWRLIIPFLSGGVAVAIYSLAISGLLPLIDATRLHNSAAVLGMSILTGYFSDNAIAALARLADKLFGTLDKGARHDIPIPTGVTDRESKPSNH